VAYISYALEVSRDPCPVDRREGGAIATWALVGQIKARWQNYRVFVEGRGFRPVFFSLFPGVTGLAYKFD
jgi:hypothetical protein